MASSSIIAWAIALLLTSLHSETLGVLGQDCYYPNGDLSTGSSREAPCFSSGGICCPLEWECMSDGLCYYPPDDFYGRYSCTDKSWGGSCPDICLYGGTAKGAEAILLCSNGKWCCDGNRSFNCCTTADTTFFDLAKPVSQAVINSLVPVTSGAPVASSTTNQRSSTPASSASSSPPQSTSDQSSSRTALATGHASTVTHTSRTTAKDGSVSTVTKVTTALASATGLGANQDHSTSHSSSNLGMIIGLALGIPLVLLLAGILIFFLWRRHRRAKNYNNSAARPGSPPMVANYNNIPPGTHAPEIAGYPVAPSRSKSGRTSELYGSGSYPNSPSSAKTSGTTPPQYSPAAQTPVMTQIPEEPQELWGGYVPYRPPRPELPVVREGSKEQ